MKIHIFKCLGTTILGERLQRATEMGFDTSKVWYHGTNQNITHFSLDKFGSNDFGWHGKAVYFTNRPKDAEPYSGFVGDFTRKQNEQKIERRGPQIIMPVFLGGKIICTKNTGANIDDLDADVLVIDYGNGYKEAVVKNLSKIRSIHAKFNLDKAGSTNILD